MKILTHDFIKNNQDFIISEIKKGKTFIYPTDTLIGIGCDATNDNSVKKIYQIKQRNKKPFLVIAPSLNWIYKNCEFYPLHKKKIESKLPGPYSFIVKLKNQNAISKKILNQKETLGIRIPNSYFTKIIEKSSLPFVTTSVNLAGEPSATSIKEIPKEIKNQIDYIIKTNEIMSGKSSTILDITQNKIKQLR